MRPSSSTPEAGHPTDDAEDPATHPVLAARLLILAGTVVVLDQASKLWVTSALTEGRPIRLLGDLLSLRLTYNPGAAFSIGAAYTWIFTAITAVAVVAIGVTARRVHSRAWAICLGLILGGAGTHLLDRLFREPGFGRGHVVDFIDYAGFFVGNIADISLVAGALLWVVLSGRGVGLDGRRPADRDTAD